MNENRPKVSIIMGIYNCSDTLDEAIQSILKQTFTNWELIICDDGSSDNTYEIGKQYESQYPGRIIILKNDCNKGLNYTLNKCLKKARGIYIARMDGDDISLPERLEKEVDLLDTKSDIAIVSTEMQNFDHNGIWGVHSAVQYPEKIDFVRRTPFCHAPCMVRSEAYFDVKGYSESKWLLRVEDYHLWIKMYSKGYKGENILEPLYQMRDDRNAYSRRKFKYRLNETYVKVLAIKMLHLPKYLMIYAFRPIAVGLLPRSLYDKLHKINLRDKEKR